MLIPRIGPVPVQMVCFDPRPRASGRPAISSASKPSPSIRSTPAGPAQLPCPGPQSQRSHSETCDDRAKRHCSQEFDERKAGIQRIAWAIMHVDGL